MAMAHRPAALVSGQRQAGRVDHHDVIAGVHMRREARLVLAAQHRRDVGRQPPQHQALGIDHQPAPLYLVRLRRIGSFLLRPHNSQTVLASRSLAPALRGPPRGSPRS
jgi:hypothetical protein